MVAAVKVRLRIGSSGEGLLTDTVLADLVNQAMRKFSRDYPWPWLIHSTTVTIATTGIAPLPADTVASRQVVIDNAVAEYVGIDEFVGSQNRYVWTDDGVQLRFEPASAANKTATLWYHRYEPALATDNQSPLAPVPFHDLIVLWAAVLGARIRRDMDLADELAREYDRESAGMRDDRNRKRGGRHQVVIRDELNRDRATW